LLRLVCKEGVCSERTALNGKRLCSDGECFISVDEVAANAMTINYEIICGISKRVPKVYIKK